MAHSATGARFALLALGLFALVAAFNAGTGRALACADQIEWDAYGYNAGVGPYVKPAGCHDLNVDPVSQAEYFKGCWYQHYCGPSTYAQVTSLSNPTVLWPNFTVGDYWTEWTTSYNIYQYAWALT